MISPAIEQLLARKGIPVLDLRHAEARRAPNAARSLPQCPTLNALLRHELRREVCRSCPWRPAFTRHVALDWQLACEAGGGVFRSLPRLREIARQADLMICDVEGAVFDAARDFGATRRSRRRWCPGRQRLVAS